MQTKEIALALLLVLSTVSATAYFLTNEEDIYNLPEDILFADPLIQEEGHDHMEASMHNMSSGNIKQIEYNPLTNGGNAEVTVADSPDGRTYAYQAGWSEFHITDVTDHYKKSLNEKNTNLNNYFI